MAKKIAIIELYYHHEVVLWYTSLLLAGGNEVLLILPASIIAQLPEPLIRRTELIQYEESLELAVFFDAQQAKLKEVDGIIISTIGNDFYFWATYPWAQKTWLIIHNYNSFFTGIKRLKLYRKRYLWEFRLYLQTVYRLLLKQEIKWRKAVLNRTDYWSHFSPEVHNYLIQQYPAFKNKAVSPIPVYYHRLPSENKPQAIFELVIPGSISAKGRDYWSLLQELPALDHKMKDQKLQITFLGTSKDKEGQKAIQAIQEKQFLNIKIRTFSERISDIEYAQIMSTANALLLPLKREAYFSIFHETIGETKASAIIVDAIHYGKPTILPAFYPIPEAFQTLFIPYDKRFRNWDLQLLQLLDRAYLQKLNVQINAFLETQTIKEQSLKLNQKLNQLF